MKHPVILAVDDEPAVLGAVARDLRREYGSRYRILRAASGEEALELLRQLRLRAEPVALLLVDQRMPGVSGVELLAEAMQLFPDAKRVLLTAYADTEVAIRAINQIRLDHYLTKPWDPPEERLFPVLTDLLDDWEASFTPPFEGVTVLGHRWSAQLHGLKDFLGRNLVPYRWFDVEEHDEARQIMASVPSTAPLPLVVFPDGSYLAQPTPDELAAKLGLKTRPGLRFYDLIIVGGGPAGLAAAVYGASEGLKTLLIEGEAPGGQAGTSSSIENYLGFPRGLSGGDLTRRAVSQAERFGAEILRPLRATGVRVQDTYRFVSLSDGSEVGGHVLLIATGVSYRKLEVPGAERLAGTGLYYGSAITEALEARDRDVCVLGGGNSAGQSALYLARYARSVTMLVRAGSLAPSMSRYLIDQIESNPAITVRTHARVDELIGEPRLCAVRTTDTETGETHTVPAYAFFVFIGAAPHTEWLGTSVARDGQGFIVSGPDVLRNGKQPSRWPLRRAPFWLETSVPGIFVAGDVRHRSIKRVASAVGEGAMAVQFIHQYLGSL
jgi:thioredoxin reductase (NADPH)